MRRRKSELDKFRLSFESTGETPVDELLRNMKTRRRRRPVAVDVQIPR